MFDYMRQAMSVSGVTNCAAVPLTLKTARGEGDCWVMFIRRHTAASMKDAPPAGTAERCDQPTRLPARKRQNNALFTPPTTVTVTVAFDALRSPFPFSPFTTPLARRPARRRPPLAHRAPRPQITTLPHLISHHDAPPAPCRPRPRHRPGRGRTGRHRIRRYSQCDGHYWDLGIGSEERTDGRGASFPLSWVGSRRDVHTASSQGFANPANESFTYPKTTGISYSLCVPSFLYRAFEGREVTVSETARTMGTTRSLGIGSQATARTRRASPASSTGFTAPTTSSPTAPSSSRPSATASSRSKTPAPRSRTSSRRTTTRS